MGHVFKMKEGVFCDVLDMALKGEGWIKDDTKVMCEAGTEVP